MKDNETLDEIFQRIRNFGETEKKNKVPNCPGTYEWFNENGTKKFIEVFDVDGHGWLRVYWAGGYYNVKDYLFELFDAKGNKTGEHLFKAEWPNNWGERIGNVGCLPNNQLYQT